MMNNILIISHRRSGTHLTIDTIINNSKRVSNKFLTLETISKNHPDYIGLSNFIKLLEKNNDISIIKSHIQKEKKTKFKVTEDVENFSNEEKKFIDKLFAESKIIYVYRDGRDVMVSLYLYIKKLKGENFKLTFYEFLKEYLGYWVEHITNWKETSDVLKISFEEFAYNYERALKKLFNFLGIELVENHIDLYRNFPNKNKNNVISKSVKKLLSFLNLYKPQIFTAVSPRKGKVGEWKNYFNRKEVKFFKKKAGSLLMELGYEKNLKWK